MPLDPKLRQLLEKRPAKPTILTKESIRRHQQLIVKERPMSPPQPVEFRDDIVEGVPVRIYDPELGTKLPAMLWFHGGGWVSGELTDDDSTCGEIAARAGCIVISVGYGLAPEHKFPGPLEDCLTVLNWAGNNSAIEKERVGVSGSSAGGNLAAALALLSRDRKGPKIKFQLLICGAYDCNPETASYKQNAVGYGLERSQMIWYWEQYLRDEKDRENPYASPLRAKDLSSLPQALVIAAEYDILRDEARAYAKRLVEANVKVEYSEYSGMGHSFVGMRAALDQGKLAMDKIVDTLCASL
jgi:acetyl esterase